MYEIIVQDEQRPGIELLTLRGGPGYGGEHFQLENGLGNGLRILMGESDEDDGDANGPDYWTHFHINSPETARLIAAKLLEWCERMANPPDAEARELSRQQKAQAD